MAIERDELGIGGTRHCENSSDGDELTHGWCSYIFCSSPFSGHLDPVTLGRRRTRRRTRWRTRRRPRSCQRRGSTALFRSALDKGLALKLATHMVADLYQLSDVKTPQTLTIFGRTHEFDPLQRPHKGPSPSRRLTFLHDCQESPGIVLRRIDVRPKVCEPLI